MAELLTLSGGQAAPYVEELARLRIAVFREYPYLYEGDMAYETAYLDTFLQAQDNVLILVREQERIVGASTGLPMVEETDNIKEPLIEAGYNIQRVFYYGESVLLPEYRGQGWGKAFFAERERFARSLGRFDTLTFCAVERPEGHPLRPAGYQPLDPFWKQQGFEPTSHFCYIRWQERGETEEKAKPLRYWVKG